MKKRVVIYGTGRSASIVYEKTAGQFGDEFAVQAFLSESAQNTKELPVIDFGKLREQMGQGLLEGVILPSSSKRMPEILERLRTSGVKTVYFVPGRELRKEKNDRHSMLIELDVDKPWLMGFEYHVADHCNLNCLGCGHCANLMDPTLPEIGSYERDLRRLKELYAGIGLIRLMGGEPLLNPGLEEYIRLTKEYFPVSELHVVTNGLLLVNAGEALLKTVKEEGVLLDISQYPPTVKHWDEISRVLDTYGIERNVSPVTEFYKRFTLNEVSDSAKVFAECSTRTCHSLRDGKIAACIVPFSTEVLNRTYHTEIPVDGWIDIYEDGISGEEINRRLELPLGLCSHCRAKKEFFKWEVRAGKDALLTDWICEEE